MTLIPFRRAPENHRPATVVTDGVAYDPNGDAILIRQADETQLQHGTSIATYDLRIGRAYRDHRWIDPRTLDDGQVITLEPGSAVIIQTLEDIKLPVTRFGQIAPKVSLLESGIANTPSKIDPGYEGHLNITVFNHGRRTVPLTPGQKFCALFVTDVQLPVSPYDGVAKQIGSAPGARRSRWKQAVDFLDRRAGLIAASAALLSMTATIVAVIGNLS